MVSFFCTVPTHTDWTPDFYDYSYDDDIQEENTNTSLVNHENPDWYYASDGEYHICSQEGSMLRGVYVAIYEGFSLSGHHQK